MIAGVLRQSALVGYILGGILVGPYAAGLVQDLSLVSQFADIGVILLMFTLGIEFSFSRLNEVKKIAVLGGILEVVLVVLLGVGLGQLLGLSMVESLFLGCVTAISSTMIVLRVLGEEGELNSLHGQVMLGILIVQDLAVVVMVSLLPKLGDLGATELPALGASLGIAILLVLATIYLAQKVLPVLMDRLARENNNDVFLLFALTLGLGIATLAGALGLSVSLGAFLAGLMISESDYAHEILGKIISLRDALVILFFVSVGMMVHPSSLFANLGLLAAVLVLVIPVKFLVVFFITRSFRYHSRVAFYAGMGLMQTGEFSFVLAKLGMDNQLISPQLYNVILAASLFSILLTPLFTRIAPHWYHQLRKLSALKWLFPEPELETAEDNAGGLSQHVILLGYGRMGHHVGLALQQFKLPFVVIEYDYHVIERLRNGGISYIYGDASNPHVLEKASPETARLAILALPDSLVNQMVLRTLLQKNPSLRVICRAQNHREEQLMFESGAYEVVQPEEEAGLQMVRQVILGLDLPPDDVVEYLENMYLKDYHEIIYQQDSEQSEALKVRNFKVEAGSPFAGKTLRESRIREETGCSVVTILTGDGATIANPHSSATVSPGDTLIIMGSPTQLLAFSYLNQGHEQETGEQLPEPKPLLAPQ